MENLKPCPFCGGEANLHHVGNEYTKSRKVVIKCPKCRIARTDAALTHGFDWLDNVAIAAWNQRVDVADLEAQLALYKKALDLAARDIFCPDILCDENSSKYGVCEVDCKSNYYLAQAKEAVPDGPDRS